MPTTIGALNNVPVPGDNVGSAWAIEISGYVVHPFANLAEAKSLVAAPADGMMGWLIDEDSLIVGKAGTWRWLRKTFPTANGSTDYLTIAAGATAATSWSNLSINGRMLSMGFNFVPTTSATSGAVVVATLAVPYRASQRTDCAIAISTAAGAGSGRCSNSGDGNIQGTWAAANNPSAATGLIGIHHWSVADLVAA